MPEPARGLRCDAPARLGLRAGPEPDIPVLIASPLLSLDRGGLAFKVETVVTDSRALARESVRRRPRPSAIWDRDEVEAEERRRVRPVPRPRSKSSDVCQGRSAGWVRAEARESRTGNGVKFLI